MDLDEGAHARELRVAANPDDDAVHRWSAAMPDTLETRLALGGVLGREGEGMGGAHEPLTRHAALDDGGRPGANTHECARVASQAARAGTAPTDVGTREPPPAAGMQPMNGRNVGARSD